MPREKRQVTNFNRKPKHGHQVNVINEHYLKFMQEKKEMEDREKGLLEPNSRRVRPHSVPIRVSMDELNVISPDNESRLTEVDGMIVKCPREAKVLLRRPRSAGGLPKRGPSAKVAINKQRFNIALTKKKAQRFLQQLRTPSYADLNFTKNAAELCFDESVNPSNPHKNQKERLIQQYNLWNGTDVNKMSLPKINQSKEIIITEKASPTAATLASVDNPALRRMGVSMKGHHISFPKISSSRSSHIYSKASKVDNKRYMARSFSDYSNDAMDKLISAMKGLL